MPGTFCSACASSSTCTSISDRKSTRLNSSHSQISYADFCLTKKPHALLRRFRLLLRYGRHDGYESRVDEQNDLLSQLLPDMAVVIHQGQPFDASERPPYHDE